MTVVDAGMSVLLVLISVSQNDEPIGLSIALLVPTSRSACDFYSMHKFLIPMHDSACIG